MSILRQGLCSFIACYGCFGLGLIYTWPSSTIKYFSSVNTKLDRPMTEIELSLFGSLSSISAIIGTPLSGYLLDKVGRKYSSIFFALPLVIAWVIIISISKVEAILTAIFISGISGSTMLIAPVYVSEFCQESIRGRMTAGAMLMFVFGTLASYLLGGLMDYVMMNYLCLSLSALWVVIMALMAESPTHLMKTGKEEEAAKAIAFFRSINVDSKIVVEEMNIIRRALNPEMDDETPETEKLKTECNSEEKLSFWKFMKKSRSSRSAILMSFILYTACNFQGLVVVQVFAEPVFEEVVPNMSPTVSSVLFAVITMVAGIIAAYMVDVSGRRPLMIYSSICTGVCCVILGAQIQFHFGPHWMTAIFMYLYCIAYTFGAGTVPFVIVAEIFLPEIRSIASMLSVEWAWILNFITLFIFNPVVTLIGLGGVFHLFGGVCFLSAIYSYFYLPETTGLTVDVIQNLFIKKPRRNARAWNYKSKE